MSERIKSIFYSVNNVARFVGLVGLILALLQRYLLTDVAILATVVGIYTYVMIAFAAILAISTVAMVIRTVLKFRLVGLVRAAVNFFISAMIYLIYAYLVDMIQIF